MLTRRILSRSTYAVFHTSRRHMPICRLETNMHKNDIPDDLHVNLSGVIAKTFNKLEQNTVVSIHTDVPISQSGTSQPSVLLQIWHENNDKVKVESEDTKQNEVKKNYQRAKNIYEYLLPKLGIPQERINLMLYERPTYDFAHILYSDLVNVCRLP